MMRSAGVFLGLAGLLLLSGLPLQAFACGDIISVFYGDEGPFDDRTLIIDCDNPFNADNPDPFNYSFTINDQPVLPRTTVEVPEGETVAGSFSITKESSFSSDQLEIYRVEGNNYRRVHSFYPDEVNTAEFETGEYVAVFISSAVFPQVQAPPAWQQWLKSFFLPATALAYYEDYQDVVAVPFAVVNSPPAPTGASSVLFLPGIKASRLYTDGILGTENKLWEPLVNRDVSNLAMTEAGTSEEAIYTRDIIDSVLGLGSVYGDFSEYLDDLVANDVINDWQPFAYDWRYDVFDIVTSGTLHGDGNGTVDRVFVQDMVEQLSQESKSGKVTVVAHSNGGLLAKALMIELEKTGQENLIDQIIFIASPQLGTPKAIASLLHGYGEQILGGLVLDDNLARETTRNMPGTYGLLPAQKYFDNVTEGLVVGFDDSVATNQFRSQYGNTINTERELFGFLIGEEGRGSATMIEDALVLNPILASNAYKYRRDLLDTWIAPEGIKVTEVVGTGIETEAGFYYREFLERTCTNTELFGLTTCSLVEKSKPLPQFSYYGDGTVIGGSAEGYAGEKEIFYLNLREILVNDKIRINHANITESDSVQRFITNRLSNKEEDIDFFSKEKPEFNQSNYLIGIHSPVEIIVIDSEGNRTGKTGENIEETIPGSSYREIAGGKYVLIPTELEYSVFINGLSEGGYSLTFEEVLPGGGQNTIREILGATSTAAMVAEFDCVDDDCSPMSIDFDGDKITDAQFDWVEGYSNIVIEEPEVATNEENVREVSSTRSTGTRIRFESEGRVAGISDTISQAELTRLFNILVQLKIILDNWPRQ